MSVLPPTFPAGPGPAQGSLDPGASTAPSSGVGTSARTRAFRILFDCHTFDRERQGTSTYVAGVVNALPAAMAELAPDIDLRIFCAAERRENVAQHLDVPFDFVPMTSGFVRRNLLDIPLILAANRIDLVVSQYVRPFQSRAATLSVLHDVLFLDFPQSFSWRYSLVRRILFGWSARRSTYAATVSRYSAAQIAQHFGVPADRVLLTPNAIDPRLVAQGRSPRASAQGRPLRLLSVSRLETRKRHEWCIDAVEALAEAGLESELTIVGGGQGPYADEISRRASEMRSSGRRIALKRELSLAELAEEYARADVFLFPSLAEGFGIPVIEAAALGVPCVVSAGTALDELQDSYVGRSFAPESREDFIDMVKLVCSDLQRLAPLAEERSASVVRSFSWATTAAVYARVIQAEAARTA